LADAVLLDLLAASFFTRLTGITKFKH
jgi:hypothetical protein